MAPHSVRVRTGARVPRRRRHRAVLRPVHRRRVRRRRTGDAFKTVNPATEEVLAEVTDARAPPTSTAPSRAARRAYDAGLVADVRRASAASTCSGSRGSCRSARASSRCSRRSTTASRSRSPATSTSRWRPRTSSTTPAGPTSSRYAGLGPDPQPARRRRPGHPVELPAADAGVEDRAGAGRRQHRRAQAGRDDAADGAAVRRDLPAGRPAAGRRQHRHRRRRHRAGAGRAPRRRQGRVHRLHRGRQGRSPRSIAGTGKRLTLELGGKAANIVFDDAPIDQAVEGIVNGIFFNQGHVCCAGSRLLVQESVADEVARRAQAPAGDAAARRPAGQEHRHRRHQLRRAARPDPRALPTSARPRAPSAGRRRASCPTAGSGSRRRCSPASRQAHRIAREEIFGPVLSVLTFRTPAEAVAKANNTPYGLSAGVWTEKGSRILWMAEPAARGRGLGQHVQPVRPGQPVRRLQGVRATAARAAGTGWRRTSMTERQPA